MQSYRHEISDFLSLTQGLDPESIGIIVMLADRFAITENPLKTDWVNLAFKNETHEKALGILEAFFTKTSEGYVLDSIARQIEDNRRKVLKNQENGRKGGRPPKTQTKPTGFSEETQPKPKKTDWVLKEERERSKEKEESKKKNTSYSKKNESALFDLTRPQDCSEDIWQEWLAYRKQIRKPFNAHGLKLLQTEAQKAGISTQTAMTTAMANNWISFKASYTQNSSSNANSVDAVADRFKRMQEQAEKEKREKRQLDSIADDLPIEFDEVF